MARELMKKREVFTVVVSVLAANSGCAFHGLAEARAQPGQSVFEAPSPLSLRVVHFEVGSTKARERNDALVEALTEVARIATDPRFQTFVAQEPFASHPGVAPAAIGNQVNHDLTQALPSEVTFLVRSRFPWGILGIESSTTASTLISDQAISFATGRVDEWRWGRQGLLINTLAHELTHLVRSANGAQRYIDGDREPCEEARLVSYRFGDLAQCFFEAAGSDIAFAECADSTVNGSRVQRAELLAKCHKEVWKTTGT